MNPIYRFFLSTDTNLFSIYLSDTRIGHIQTPVAIAANPDYNTSGRIDVLPGDYIIIAKFASMAFYDGGNVIIKYISGNPALWGTVITVPNEATYCRVSILASDWENLTVNTARLSTPNYKDDLEKVYSIETGQRSFRASLSGKLAYIRDDYNYIYNAPFETICAVIIEKSNDNGIIWAEYYRGMFAKTDCEFDDDDLSLSVQPETVDEYNDVMAGLEKEYNLITLAPTIERITVQKRPLIQIYSPGDDIISGFLGGTYWEQDANSVTSRNELINKYFFALCNIYKEYRLEPRVNAPADIAGVYTGRLAFNTATQSYEGKLYDPNNSKYYVTVTQRWNNYYFTRATSSLYRSYDNVLLFQNDAILGSGWLWENEAFVMSPMYPIPDPEDETHVWAIMTTPHSIYARYLLDVETLRGQPTHLLPSEDIVTDNRNYKRAIGYTIDVAYISNRSSIEPTEWGRMESGRYYLPPNAPFGQQFYPIARSTWADTSIWFGFATVDSSLEVEGRKPYTLRDTFPVWSCINQLLKQFAPHITHEGTAEYSQFLYGSTNPISHDSFKLFVTQKSNVLAGEYTQPAQKAPATLQQFLNMLRDCFRCYWFIEDGKLRIEHINWFRNGGSYSPDHIVGIDTTALYNSRNGKQFSYDTTKWSYDKLDMPERFQFSWMDDLTLPFDGNPIDVRSKYIQRGKIENISLAVFNSDIDLMLLNPGAMSMDGFALLAAKRNASNQYELPITQTIVEGVTYYLQNGLLAFMNLQPKYYMYDMPARRVTVNGQMLNNVGITRNLKQNIVLPIGENDPDPVQLIKTEIGDGEIEKININLHSRSAKIILRYDTDTQK